MKYENFYDFVCHEKADLDEKARRGEVTLTDVQYGDVLEHYKKSHLTNEAMEGAGYSNHGYMHAYDGDRMDDGSYARGRRNAPRDSMGRYSGERGYSRAGLADELRGLMHDAPDERTRQEIQRLADKLENM